MSRNAYILAAALILGAVGAAPAVAARKPPAPPPAGPFTAAQADRGQQMYAVTCASCHGEDMSGGANGPALSGPDFAFHYKGRPAKDLAQYIAGTMPPTAPASLTAQQYLDVTAAILRKNGAVPGGTELTPEAEGLDEIGIP
jgi:mono/diheme cytochrome c family protein